MYIKPLIKPSKVNSNGEAVIFFRIYINGEQTLISSKLKVKPIHWDNKAGCFNKKSENQARLNALLNKKKSELEKIMLSQTIEEESIPVQNVKKVIKGENTKFDFLKYANAYKANLLLVDNYSMYKRTNSVINKLQEFNKSKRLPISKFNLDYISRYESYLLGEKKNSINTVTSNLKLLKTITNNAIKQGLISHSLNPFLNHKNKNVKTSREFLTELEIQKLKNLEFKIKKFDYHTRNIYLFAYYCAGIRISDLLQLKWSNLNEGRINFTTLKTDTQMNIKLPIAALEIINEYKVYAIDSNGDLDQNKYIFPLLRFKKEGTDNQKLISAISSANARLNKSLKRLAVLAEINKKITFHTSRHSFASNGLVKKIPIQNISKLLGHQNLRETQIYAKIVNEELDKSMDLFN
jgi:integrase/recombinase XerD